MYKHNDDHLGLVSVVFLGVVLLIKFGIILYGVITY